MTGICWGTGDRVTTVDDPETGQPVEIVIDDKVCPVRAECEAFGEDNNMLGVWGGKVRSSKDHLRGLKNGHQEPDEPEPEDTITPVTIVQDGRLKKVANGRHYSDK